MSDWKELRIPFDVETVDQSQLYNIICKKLNRKGKYWIAEVDLDVQYKIFRSLREMVEDFWIDWPSEEIEDFIEEYKIDEKLPLIIAEHDRQYYMLATMKLAEDFLTISKVIIKQRS